MSLTYRGTDLQTANIHFDVARGFNEPAEVRGEDDVVPEASGRAEGAWIEDQRTIILEGHVEGTGATLEERQQSWRTASDSLRTIMDRTASPGALVMGPPDHGVDAEWSINARCVSAIPGPILNAWTFQRWSFELVCIDSPPEWVEESS